MLRFFRRVPTPFTSPPVPVVVLLRTLVLALAGMHYDIQYRPLNAALHYTGADLAI